MTAASLGLATFAVYSNHQRTQELERSARKNEQIGQFFTSIFTNLDAYEVKNKSISVIDFMDTLYKESLTSFDEYPDTKLSLLVEVGNILDEIDYQKSIKVIKEAVSLLENHHDASKERQLALYLNLIRLYSKSNQFALGEQLIQEVESDFAPILESHQILQDEYSHSKAMLIARKGSYSEAQELLSGLEQTDISTIGDDAV